MACLRLRCRWRDLGDSLLRGRLSSAPQGFCRFYQLQWLLWARQQRRQGQTIPDDLCARCQLTSLDPKRANYVHGSQIICRSFFSPLS